jgi:hypothetical protein
MFNSTRRLAFLLAILPLAVLIIATTTASAERVKPPANPAKIKLSVEPGSVAPGGSARVTLELEPMDGVKINQYPKIQLKVTAQEGLVGAAEASMGSDVPPTEENLEANSFKEINPLHLKIELDQAAPKGEHELDAKVTYAYCMSASGFCARKRVPVKIAISVQ